MEVNWYAANEWHPYLEQMVNYINGMFAVGGSAAIVASHNFQLA